MFRIDGQVLGIIKPLVDKKSCRIGQYRLITILRQSESNLRPKRRHKIKMTSQLIFAYVPYPLRSFFMASTIKESGRLSNFGPIISRNMLL